MNKKHTYFNRCRKSFWQNSAPNYDKLKKKTLQKVSTEGTYLNIIKAIYIQPITNIILNGEKLKAVPLRSGTRHRCSLLPLLFNIVLEVLATVIREEKEIQWIQIGKEVKFSLFENDMILYIEDPIRCYHKTIRAHQSIGNTAGYKINTHKSAAFLYANNERS